MPEFLKRQEVIATLPSEWVSEISSIVYEKQSIAQLLDALILRHQGVLRKEDDFWDKVRKEYLIMSDMDLEVNFKTGELRKK